MIDAISSILSAMLTDETTFARAEALYSESFRSDRTFTVADGFYDREELVQYLMEPIYKLPGELHSACRHDEEDEFGMCLEPEVLKPGWRKEQAELYVDQVEFVELCNYKGESEGFEMASRASHLRVFVSKYEYRAAE
ncbi:hypothetical protein [Pseudomonas mosselii]|uniref:hypothetical protein n=1 Tax=Pseudomonas mosselii TaxID=78327 RepID=UPI0021DAFB65|nr:hypothetical protein [Pseudomonas mosselii]MCU9527497.1 hypothetical protein [Pseudomonas mosselii]MCU9534810.1 hypothetical protein [Pseudomonas mosselii]MCU9542744.1 hypothetical protein [Pseudomonas mosselii]MCU9546650.1 hypothetical protein [Pseudomonas mosselii]